MLCIFFQHKASADGNSIKVKQSVIVCKFFSCVGGNQHYISAVFHVGKNLLCIVCRQIFRGRIDDHTLGILRDLAIIH